MQTSLNLTVPLGQLAPPGHAFFLNHEDAFEQLLEFCPRDRPARAEDRQVAIRLMLPGDLTGIDACFSPGVADRTALERELAARHGIHRHLCDGSVDGQGLDLDPALQHFQQRWLGSHDNDTTLSLDACWRPRIRCWRDSASW
jgi:hypothetical protein